MQRILETEYMDTAEDSLEYDAMDHGDANANVVRDYLALGSDQGLLLDLGTGPGAIPLLLAQLCSDLRVVAVDAAQEMLKLARAKTQAAGLQERIYLQRVDAKRLPYADNSFDGVLSNTILHHIPEPKLFLQEAWRVWKKDQAKGALMIRDLYRPDSEEQAWALVDQHCAAGTKGQRQLLFDSLHAALTLTEARQMVEEAGMLGASVEMTSDRHYTIVCRPAVSKPE